MKILMSVILPLLAFSFVSCKTSKPPESQMEDLGSHKGYTVYRWPERSKIKTRDYDSLDEQMTQFAESVGHCLKRAPAGASEEAWACGIRQERMTKVYAAIGSARRWCDAVKEQLVDDFLPTAPLWKFWQHSPYCQYANCGEGGKVGACLAYDHGFHENEIRLCASKNDHMFAMVVGPPGKKWCLLDRWAIIDNFRCGIDWDVARQVVTVDGKASDESWFQKVNCVTIDEYMRTRVAP